MIEFIQLSSHPVIQSSFLTISPLGSAELRFAPVHHTTISPLIRFTFR
ncbi:MAG: hypothetical protein IH596_12825 [Bacteroidales bacterium]|nr:hypothetical protein [Bacteroidales bacterium]